VNGVIPQSAGSLATTVLGLRQASATKPIVLIEGHTDYLMYSKFFGHSSSYQHVVCDGKPNLIGASSKLRLGKVGNVLSICDADYDRILSAHSVPEIVMTDFHDSEMFAISGLAFDRVVQECLFAVGVSDVGMFARVRDAAFRDAQSIGRLRIHNQRENAKLNFKAVDPGAFVDLDWTFDQVGYLKTLIENSPASLFTYQDAVEYALHGAVGTDLLDLINGHDLASLTGAYTRVPFGEPAVARESIESAMRLALWPDEFGSTRMFHELAKWEIDNDADILA
jgi:hypothetical protein